MSDSARNYELLRKFFDIFNDYQSQVTGWPRHRIVQTKRGPRNWRMSHDRFNVWFHKNFILTDLLRANLGEWEFKDDEKISFEDYYRDFYRSEFGFMYAVRKDFLVKVLTLGSVPVGFTRT